MFKRACEFAMQCCSIFVLCMGVGYIGSVVWLWFAMRSETDPSWIDSFWFGTILLCPILALKYAVIGVFSWCGFCLGRKLFVRVPIVVTSFMKFVWFRNSERATLLVMDLAHGWLNKTDLQHMADYFQALVDNREKE